MRMRWKQERLPCENCRSCELCTVLTDSDRTPCFKKTFSMAKGAIPKNGSAECANLVAGSQHSRKDCRSKHRLGYLDECKVASRHRMHPLVMVSLELQARCTVDLEWATSQKSARMLSGARRILGWCWKERLAAREERCVLFRRTDSRLPSSACRHQPCASFSPHFEPIQSRRCPR